jgi:hypothetical protein
MNPLYIDKKLYKKVKRRADAKFEASISAYKSSWIVREYKRLGGKFNSKKSSSTGLKRWYREKWIDLNRPIRNSEGKIIGYKSCGRSSSKSRRDKYPLCRPSKRINKMTPRTYKSISKKSIKQAKKQKSIVKSSGHIKFGAGQRKQSNQFKKLNKLLKKIKKYIAKNNL